MGIYTGRADGIYGKAIWIATRIQPSISEILDRSGLKEDFFRLPEYPHHIDAFEGVLVKEGKLLDVSITYSKEPDFNPELLKLEGSMQGFTTLHISVLGSEEQQVEQTLDGLLSRFPDTVEMEERPEVYIAMQKAFNKILRDNTTLKGYSTTYHNLMAMMSDTKRDDNLRLENGALLGIVDGFCSLFDIKDYIAKHHTWKIQRFFGGMGETPLELSLIYILPKNSSEGKVLSPGLYGLSISGQHKTGCPVWEKKGCDQASSYAGILFNAENLFFGVTMHIPQLSQQLYRDNESGSAGKREHCLTMSLNAEVTDNWHKVEHRIDETRDLRTRLPEGITIQIPEEQFVEMKQLAKGVYDACNS